MLSFNEYQLEAYQFARYKSKHYPYIALGEECGEVQALAAKSLRKYGDLSGVDRFKLAQELGDVLWNIAAIASEKGLDLADIAEDNIDKLDVRRTEVTLVER